MENKKNHTNPFHINANSTNLVFHVEETNKILMYIVQANLTKQA
jgi:hypothetical protein